MKYTIGKVNDMDYDEFSKIFGNVIEHCSVIAMSIWSKRPFENITHLHHEICQLIDDLPPLAHEGILRSHPDLAGRIAQQGLLTTESTNEQMAAELNTLTLEESSFLTNLNNKYKGKFGFPFVICARENKKKAMLDGIAARIHNPHPTELYSGIEEVKKIAFYRIAEIVHP